MLSIVLSMLYAEESRGYEIGEILLLEGDVELSSVVSGERFSIDEHKRLKPGQKIRTRADTILDLVLDDGTRVAMRESTSLSFLYLKRKKTDPWTQMTIDFGKVRIIQKKRFINKTLELVTPTAVISVVMGDFSVIASENETRVLVHEGRVGIISKNTSIKKAFVGTRSEEITIMRDSPPSDPVLVKESCMDEWFDDFQVVDKYRRIARKDRSRELLDWIKREHERP